MAKSKAITDLNIPRRRTRISARAARCAGEWHGQLAGTLALSGAVTAEAFDRLAEGVHPQTGEQLIQHRDTIKTQAGEELGHRAGWDLTFNAPKTVSLTALVGEDDRVRHAHQEAVRVALAETEKYVQARIGGNLRLKTPGSGLPPLLSTIRRGLSMAIRLRISIPMLSCST